jgi:hypothetical protein
MIVTTDCHDRRQLGHGFDAAVASLRQAGFTSMAVLKDGSFIDIGL